MSKPTAQEIIDFYNLIPLPVEGGLYVQTYRTKERIPANVLPQRYPQQDKPYTTAILYLYTATPDHFSAIHKLPTDEIFHFYFGDPVQMLHLYPDGRTQRVILGHDILNGQEIQHVAPRDVWQGSHLMEGGEYALVGTTMAPGFTPYDYYGGERDELMAQYPSEAELIARLTRPDEPTRRMPDDVDAE